MKSSHIFMVFSDMITSMQAISSAAQAVDEEEEENDEDSEDELP
jgi:hypothetical protein